MVRWRGDEAFQRIFHQQRFRDTPLSPVMVMGQAVGTVAFTALADHVRLDEFYLLPVHQGQVLGARILNQCLAITDARGKPTRLRYLNWNPVGSLYRCHEFAVIDEAETHFIRERQPSGASPAS
ncbi:GNAT family N-acetyltransferase [Microvirga terrae]|uniref:GNAT family N-acetyltransferase n=1 Tax=Microvirga terrae TaxID=2740529 RepID=UPI003D8144B8